MPIDYLSQAYPRILFRYLRLSESTCMPFFTGTKLCYSDLMSLNCQISYLDQIQLFQNAISISKQPDLGLTIGRRLHLSAHGPLGIAISSSANLRCGIDTLIKYSSSQLQFAHFEGLIKGNEYHFIIKENLNLAGLQAFLMETTVSAIFSAIAFFTEEVNICGRICFSYSAPSYIKSYQAIFGENIIFDQSSTRIIFPKFLLSTPSPVADALQHQGAIIQCKKLINSINNIKSNLCIKNSQVSEKVATIITQNPGRLWSLNEVAEKLHISSRTLIRRLKSECTQFKNIHDDIILKQSFNYLSDDKLSIESISELLGFSDVSSFRRCFKRIVNETPIAVANRLRSS